MSIVEKLEREIERLPREEFWKLAEWFDERKANAWDRQIEADVKGGKLDKFAEEALQESREGRTRPFPE